MGNILSPYGDLGAPVEWAVVSVRVWDALTRVRRGPEVKTDQSIGENAAWVPGRLADHLEEQERKSFTSLENRYGLKVIHLLIGNADPDGVFLRSFSSAFKGISGI